VKLKSLRTGAALFLAVLVVSAAARGAEFKKATHGPASLTFVEGVPIVHVYGTPEQMGEQQGALLGPQLKLLVDQYLNKYLLSFGGDIGLRRTVLRLSRQMEKSIPRRYIEEMKALAKSARASYEDVLLANTVFDIRRAVFCSTFVAVGDRSADGQPIFGRNLDFPTLGVAHKYSCVIVYHPKKGHAVASVTFPGIVGVLSGLNDAGVAAGVMEARVAGLQTTATPNALVFRTALTGAASTEDVLRVVKTRARSTNNNLMICDAKGNAACAELSIGKVVARRPENGVIYSTNHFTSKELGRPWMCWRLPRLRKALSGTAKVDEALAKKILADVAVKQATMHSIVFRPAACSFLLAAGRPPAPDHKFVLFKKSVLFPAARKQP